ncbi:ATP-binding cassette domain-containing protein [Aureimonas pseudogalii]|uniref:Sulfonate transport system ATP-binding protein n=1 Tax=Aureimonas pseudogalii TaxID=1744844 RepID=A0A7W6E916_9HYPH|nr:ATP-binding cassette domain-containing protein [Aureimonas pseudogalii]MBB3996985.1 sulfonate transport system ATP-binding protein [Aureimonas pseudogalii]
MNTALFPQPQAVARARSPFASPVRTDAPAATPAEAARPAGAEIELRGVAKRYGDKTVLSNIDLNVRPGEFVAIVGRSGCGKSTLLRLLLGLETPDAGDIRIGGEARRAGVSARFVFQEPRLLPWQRVLANVALGADRRLALTERRRLAAEALAEVGLSERGGDWPSVLSGGQRQRVALARALVSHPRVMALDEPLGALDALTRIEMQGLLERVWREQGFTAVLVTHDVSEAVALADRIVLVEGGEITLDERVDLPRPRRRGSAAAAAIEGRILARLLGQPGAR